MHKGKVLIVDDSIISREIISHGLNDSGFEAITAASAEKAISFLQKETPELILLDINMPEMNGFTFCEIIKNVEATKNIPLIFITGTKNREITIQGFKCGCVDFITKPYEIDEIVARISVHIELEKKCSA